MVFQMPNRLHICHLVNIQMLKNNEQLTFRKDINMNSNEIKSQCKFCQLVFRVTVLLFCMFMASGSFAQRNIVTIGDSNGANEQGWVNQLRKIRPNDSIYNYSISGNTIGFDNLGNERLNTLKNAQRYLLDAQTRSRGSIDDIMILLGTNDCKKVFSDQVEDVVANMKNLINQVKQNMGASEYHIYLVTPPPIGADSVLQDKYKGGDSRIRELLPEFMKIALEADLMFVDIYHELKPQFDEYHTDGIHLNSKGSSLVASAISGFLDKYPVIAWDDEKKADWPEALKVVEIPSILDGEVQKAYFYRSSKASAQPLIVSLHTWSGDYTQRDPLIEQIMNKDWNYIHPDFRGTNNTPKACGSKYAINDIEEAIAYALENASVDAKNIHVIGSSGGGYATLYTFMNSKHDIASFSAWVPISDIEAWYYQSKGRKSKYAGHILAATGSVDENLNAEEARSRSPIFMETPLRARRKAVLNIYAGVHDGYTGSVPVSQSLRFYNKVALDFGAKDADLIPDDVICKLVEDRTLPHSTGKEIGGRSIVYNKTFRNISMTIFEGTHEMLSDVALDLLPVDYEK